MKAQLKVSRQWRQKTTWTTGAEATAEKDPPHKASGIRDIRYQLKDNYAVFKDIKEWEFWRRTIHFKKWKSYNRSSTITEVKNSLGSFYCCLGSTKAKWKDHIQAEPQRNVQMIGCKTKMTKRMFSKCTTRVLKRRVVFLKIKTDNFSNLKIVIMSHILKTWRACRKLIKKNTLKHISKSTENQKIKEK